MKNNHIYVLGTGYSHDGSACLLKDGKIAVAIEKERITRIKHDGDNDTAAIQYCLDAAGITIHDVDLVVQNGAAYDPVTDYFHGERIFNATVNVPLHNISHHLAHAYSTIGTCPFEKDYNIMIIDGSGSCYDQCMDLSGHIPDQEQMKPIPHLYYEKDSFYSYKGNQLTTICKDFSEFGLFFKNTDKYTGVKHSIGGVYEMFSKYCFASIEDTGKLMGLGPYGEKGRFTAPLFNLKDGRVFVNYDVVDEFTTPSRSFDTLKKNFQYYADIARWVQEEVEKAILYTFESRLQLNHADNICFAGGVALNAVANAKLLDKLPIKGLYMQPAAADNGIAIGCAYYGWLEILKKEAVKHNGSVFLGREYKEEEILDTIDNFLVYDPLLTKTKIDEFLGQINTYSGADLSGRVLQISLPDIGIYQLLFTESEVEVCYGLKAIPTSAITVEGRYFLNGMRDLNYFNRLLNERKLTITNQMEIGYILQALDFAGLSLPDVHSSGHPFSVRKSEDIAFDTAALLAAGKVIGLFKGGAEFGPRSLGHRSIIADPSAPGIRDYINGRIKLREDFRPFAPAVLEEDLLLYFKKPQESPYMILVNEIREEWKEKLISVTHQNDSSRVQTVSPTWNSHFYNILSSFKQLTGLSVLLNTSFNRKGMPMIETPAEALEFLYISELDYVIMEDYIIEKANSGKTDTEEILAEAAVRD